MKMFKKMHLSRFVRSRVPEDRVGQDNFTLQPLLYLQSTKPKPHFRQAVRQRQKDRVNKFS